MANAKSQLAAEVVFKDQASKTLKGVQKEMNTTVKEVEKANIKFADLQNGVGELGKVAAVAFGAGVAGIVHFVNEAKNAEVAEARLTQILKTATDATDAQVASLLRQSDALEQVGVVSGDAIQAAQGTLATFDLQAESIERLIPSFLNMVVAEKGVNATQEDLIGMSNALGKVLQGQVGALSKQGFVFDEATEKLLKFGTEEQKITALTEILNSTYSGLNERMRSTTEGAMKGFEMSLGKISEDIGKVLIPMINDLVAQIQPVIDAFSKWFNDLTPSQKEFIAQSLLIGTAIMGAVAAIGLLVLALNPITITIGLVIGSFALLAKALYDSGVTWEAFALAVQEAWFKIDYEVSAAIANIQYGLAELTGTSKEQLQVMADDLNENLQKKYANYANSHNQLVRLERDNYDKQKKEAEDHFAELLDIYNSASGEEKAVAHLAAMEYKAEVKNKFQNIRLTTTEELAKLRVAEAEELDKTNTEMATKFLEQAKGATLWGNHLIENLSKGIWARLPLLGGAIAAAQLIMNKIHQSYNPELPAQLWGEHFLENFVAGMKESQPKVFAQTEEMQKALRSIYGEDGEIKKILAEWTKDKATSERFAQIAEQVNKQTEELRTKFEDQKAAYQELNVQAGAALNDLKEKHEQELTEINRKIQETKDAIRDLNENYKIDVQNVDSSIGAEIVKQQDLVADLQKQLEEARYNHQDTGELDQRLQREMTALQNFMNSTQGFEEEIAEARRRNNLTDFERFIEDTDARKAALEEEFTKRLELLEQEKTSLEDQKNKENFIFAEKLAQYTKLQEGFIQMQTVFQTGLSTMATVAQQKVSFINQQLSALEAAVKRIGDLTKANPGIAPIPTAQIPQGFADGGIATGSKNGYATILHGTEAVVPLPNGRSIPVELNGNGGGKTVTINLNFGDVNISNAVDKKEFFAEIEDHLARSIQLQKLGSN